ncbi:MAG: cell envelope biosis protein OmpA [Bacteroidetes bacterium]|nr:cell envelope biosis protein OmpA [Bacteroidota bacterium]
MKLLTLIIVLYSLFPLTAHAQENTKIFLVNKEEYKYLESKNLLITRAIENAFGRPNKQNYYSLEINQVDANMPEMQALKYYPVKNDDQKKSELTSKILKADKNQGIEFKVNINKEKSELTEAIKTTLNDKNTFVIKIVVVADPKIFVTEAIDKTTFFNIIDEKSFTDKAFKKFFGDNPKKTNYNIGFDKMNACLIKNIISGVCNEQFDGASYEKFAEKVTSKEYGAGFILIDLHIIREKSKLTPEIEAAIIKAADGSEHLKFYFCIPKDNIRVKKKKQFNMEGKIVSESKLPVKNLTVFLRDAGNVVIATQITDSKGTFKFDNLNEGPGYSLFIDNSCKEKMLYLLNKKDELLGKYQKTEIGFVYKLLDADIIKLSDIEESDPSGEFLSSVRGRMLSVTDKVAALTNQVIELKNSGNQIIQSQKTDMQGNFEFLHLDPKANYSIELPEYVSISKSERIYLANTKNELLKEFVKDKNNKFSYKILPADMQLLSGLNEMDVEMTFTQQKNSGNKDIIINDFIYFNLNSAQISPQSKPTLDKVVKIIKENPNYKLEIISHTDCRGDNTTNQKLSEKRGESVKSYLISKSIDPEKLKSMGMGESKPLNSCVDGSACLEDEYQMNRRTEFRFYK